MAEMNKAEMVARIEELEMENARLKASRKRGSGRKLELLEVMAQGPAEMLDIANTMNISTKNVSSLFCYLKKDGWTVRIEDGKRQIVKHNGKRIDDTYILEYVQNERTIIESAKEEDSNE